MPRRTGVLICVLLLVTTGCANRRPPVASWIPDRPTEVRSSFEYGHVFVYASVNDSEPMKFFFDTGAGINSITPDAADRAGMIRSGTIRLGDSNDVVRRTPVAQAARLEVGPVLIQNIGFTILEFDDLQFEDEESIAGFIGLDGLGEFTVDVDYIRQVFHISNERLDPSDPTTVPMRFDRYRLPQIPLIFRDAGEQSRTHWATLDTGGDTFLRLDRDQSTRYASQDWPIRRDIASGAHRTSRIIHEARLSEGLRVGGTHVHAVYASINESRNLIGHQILRAFRLTVDGPSRLVALSRPGAEDLVCVAGLGLGWVTEWGGEYSVALVLTGSPAEEAGLLNGDRIVSIEGLAIGEIPTPTRFWPLAPASPSIMVHVIRRTADTSIELVLEVKHGAGSGMKTGLIPAPVPILTSNETRPTPPRDRSRNAAGR